MNSSDIARPAVEVSPPIIYVAMHLFGVALPYWAALMTIGYIALQMGFLIWRWRRAIRRDQFFANIGIEPDEEDT